MKKKRRLKFFLTINILCASDFFPFSILSRWWWFYCCCYCVCCSLYICNSFAIWIHSKITIYASSWRCRTRITTIRIEFKIMEIKSIHQTASMCDCEQRFYGVSWDEYWQKRQQSNGVNGIGICEALNSAYIFYIYSHFSFCNLLSYWCDDGEYHTSNWLLFGANYCLLINIWFCMETNVAVFISKKVWFTPPRTKLSRETNSKRWRNSSSSSNLNK